LEGYWWSKRKLLLLDFKEPFSLKRLLTILSLSILAITSCSPVRRIPQGSYLLKSNRIEVDNPQVDKNDLNTYIRQKPNRKLLGFYRFHLQVYLLADKGRQGRIKSWFKNTIGEAPVIYDEGMMESSRKQFELYMLSKGFFNASVESKMVPEGKKKAVVEYHITSGTPYTLRNIKYNISDPQINTYINQNAEKSLLFEGMNYDTEILQDERTRITSDLRNEGFYNFSRDFIIYQADSSLGTHQVDIELQIRNPQERIQGRSDSISYSRHKRYSIRHLYIQPDFSPFRPDSLIPDTLIYYRRSITHDSLKTPLNTNTFFSFFEPMRIKPSVIRSNIYLHPQRVFKTSNLELTYNRLSSLRNHKYINIQLFESPDDSLYEVTDSTAWLDAHIQLSPSPASSYSIETEGLNSSGNLGMAGNILFQNKSIFKGAEIFTLRLKAALEASGEGGSNVIFANLPFNTIEWGADAGIDFPKLLFSGGNRRLSRYSQPKSTINTGVNFRKRPDYTRYIFSVSYGFEWSESEKKKHVLYPIDISTIKLSNDSAFLANISNQSPILLSRYRDQLIAGLRYSYFYSSQKIDQEKDFVYFKGNIESAGNLLNVISTTTNIIPKSDNHYKLFNIRYAQYLKLDCDVRYYKVFSKDQTLVLRMMAGIGFPYGNLNVLPFVKSFYSGGANGVRAWKIYSLGPGSFSGATQREFDRYGDIKFESNIEYRFGIYKFWKAALFTDIGNVWFLRENKDFPGGNFKANQFFRSLAVGSGIGLRLDFSFFIVRFDLAVPVKDPSKETNNQWISTLPSFKDFNFNLGIGYPF